MSKSNEELATESVKLLTEIVLGSGTLSGEQFERARDIVVASKRTSQDERKDEPRTQRLAA